MINGETDMGNKIPQKYFFINPLSHLFLSIIYVIIYFYCFYLLSLLIVLPIFSIFLIICKSLSEVIFYFSITVRLFLNKQIHISESK